MVTRWLAYLTLSVPLTDYISMSAVPVTGPIVMQNSQLLPQHGQNHHPYSLHLPTEGWPGLVGLGGWFKYPWKGCPSQYWPGLTQNNLVDLHNAVNIKPNCQDHGSNQLTQLYLKMVLNKYVCMHASLQQLFQFLEMPASWPETHVFNSFLKKILKTLSFLCCRLQRSLTLGPWHVPSLRLTVAALQEYPVTT